MNTLIGDSIPTAKSLLESGEVIAIPTETVYGLAGNALSPSAVARIFEVKARPTFNPLIVHIGQLEELDRYVTTVPLPLVRLMEHFWPGPVTFLLPKRPLIPDLVTAGSHLVAVRIPSHPLALELLQQLRFPLAAPSANPFMYVSPTTAQHVADQLSGKIPYILDGGPCTVGVESTILSYDGQDIVVQRLGGLALEAIEAIAGQSIHLAENLKAPSSTQVVAPGQLKRHYAANKPTFWTDALPKAALAKPEALGFVGFDQLPVQLIDIPPNQVQLLSPDGDLNEAAAHLFQALRLLDQHPEVKTIALQRFPDVGLGRAINDRLERATAL